MRSTRSLDIYYIQTILIYNSKPMLISFCFSLCDDKILGLRATCSDSLAIFSDYLHICLAI